MPENKTHPTTMKKIYLSLASALAVISVSAQVNVQTYGSFVKNLNPDYKGKAFGAGLRFEFGGEESQVSYYAGLHYTAPITTKEELYAQAMSNMTDPSSVPVTASYKLPIYRLDGGIRYYITGGPAEYQAVNFYLNGGVELCFVPNKPTYSEFDRELYTLGYSPESDVNEDGTEKRAINLALAIGTGVEKKAGPGNVFLQVALAFPAFAQGDDGSDLAAFTPIPLNVNLGYKIPFGRR
jgi:hypothetical protein